MAILKINFAVANYQQLPFDTFLSNSLKGDASAAIIEHLTKYHSQNGEVCQINDFDVDSASLQNEKAKGTVVINYAIQYHYGCADITRAAKDHETWRFEITADTLLLYMPEYDVRSTADEF